MLENINEDIFFLGAQTTKYLSLDNIDYLKNIKFTFYLFGRYKILSKKTKNEIDYDCVLPLLYINNKI